MASVLGLRAISSIPQAASPAQAALSSENQSTHIIGKLPAVDYPLMPEVEHVSMQLARMAGVDVCQTELVPLQRQIADHDYDLGEPDPAATKFLAVPRYDREGTVRVHAEDFAQVLGFAPHEKYTPNVPYMVVMRYCMEIESLGEKAVLELLRRLAVNELIGNPDCHLKNIGVYFPDDRNPALPPAYDIVAHHVYTGAEGHALYILPPEWQNELVQLQHQQLSRDFQKAYGRLPEGREIPQKFLLLRPSHLKALSEAVGMPYKQFQATADAVVREAARQWPAAIDASTLTRAQKAKMKDRLERHPAVQAVRRRGVK